MKIAQMLPPKVRAVVYSVLAAAVAVEEIFDVVPDGWETKALKVATILGFGLAVGNVPLKKD